MLPEPLEERKYEPEINEQYNETDSEITFRVSFNCFINFYLGIILLDFDFSLRTWPQNFANQTNLEPNQIPPT